MTDIGVASFAITIVCVPSVTLWAGGGAALRQFLADAVRARWFNRGMAALLVASTGPILFGALGA